MALRKDSTEGLGRDPSVLRHRKKTHSLKEQLVYNRDNMRTRSSGGGPAGNLPRSEGLEINMVSIPTPTEKPRPEYGLDTITGRSGHLSELETSVSPESTSPHQPQPHRVTEKKLWFKRAKELQECFFRPPPKNPDQSRGHHKRQIPRP